MVEGIKPRRADQFRSPVSVSTCRYSSPPLNFASTLKISDPDFSFCASHDLRLTVDCRLQWPPGAFVI
jgi:hypothetical protein